MDLDEDLSRKEEKIAKLFLFVILCFILFLISFVLLFVTKNYFFLIMVFVITFVLLIGWIGGGSYIIKKFNKKGKSN